MESGCSSYGCFEFRCFCLLQGQRLQPRRARDSGPICVFVVFIWSFGPKPPGTFARPETPALGFGDSSHHDFLGGACPSNGSRSLLDAWPETWARDSRVSAQQRLVFVGDLYKASSSQGRS
jgi:hypothetical protein